MAVSGGWAVSYERGTPVEAPSHYFPIHTPCPVRKGHTTHAHFALQRCFFVVETYLTHGIDKKVLSQPHHKIVNSMLLIANHNDQMTVLGGELTLSTPWIHTSRMMNTPAASQEQHGRFRRIPLPPLPLAGLTSPTEIQKLHLGKYLFELFWTPVRPK